MPRGRSTEDTTILSMALVGYEAEKKRIEAKINEIQGLIGSNGTNGTIIRSQQATSSSSAPRKRVLSAAARKRIAAAQKRRWAEHRKRVAASAKA